MHLKSLAVAFALSTSRFSGAAHAALVVSTAPSSNVTCTHGTCTATAQRAVLNVHTLAANLQRHDTSIVSGSSAMDIQFDAPLHWTASHRLTIDACRSIKFTEPVTSQGNGGIAMTYNDGCTGGDLFFLRKGRVAFWDTSSSLTINGNAYMLVNDLAALASNIAANPSGFYALARDYDASKDGLYASAVVSTSFAGVFEGLGHDVRNLKLRGDGHAGLFATNDGLIRDVRIENATAIRGFEAGCFIGFVADTNDGTISGVFATGNMSCKYGEYAGGLVGQNNRGGTIEDSHAAVSLTAATRSAGGLVGVNGGTILRSYASGSVAGAASVGGLVGLNSGLIEYAHATGDISRSASGGGLVGSAGQSSAALYAYATGNVSSSKYAGGLFGEGGGTIEYCYATGSVSGTGYSGGLVGLGGGIGNSYSVSSVSGRIVGGLVGYIPSDYGSIALSTYAAGPLAGGTHVGGLIGINTRRGRYQDPSGYWDVDTTGAAMGCSTGYCPRVIPLSTVQFQSGLPGGFDSSIWGENSSINNGLPYLLQLPPQ